MRSSTVLSGVVAGLAGALAGGLLLSGGRPAVAQQDAAARGCCVATVDVSKLINEYQRRKDFVEEMRRWQDQLEMENQGRRARIDAEQAAIDAMDPQDPAALARQRELVMMQIDYKNWAEMMQAEMQREDTVWTSRMYGEVVAAVEQVASSQGLSVVLQREPFQPTGDAQRLREQIFGRKVVHAATGADITQIVLDRMNTDYRAKPRTPMIAPAMPAGSPSGLSMPPPKGRP